MATIALLVILNGLAGVDLVAAAAVLPEHVPDVVLGDRRRPHLEAGCRHVRRDRSGASSCSARSSASRRSAWRCARARSTRDAARLLGVRTSWLLGLGWGFAAVLGAVSGMMVAPTVFLTPNMMQAILIYAFAAAILGGLESPVGAVVGGLALGVAANDPRHVRQLRHARSRAARRARRAPRRAAPPSGRSARTRDREARVSAPTLIGFAALVAVVVVAPFVFSALPQLPARVRRGLPDRALGLTSSPGYTGQISLGHGAFMGIGAYTTTILVVDHGWRDLWTIPVAGLVAGPFGLAFGLPATRFSGPYLALATFAIPLSFIGLLKRFPHFTGGNVGKHLPQLHPEFGWHTSPSIWFYSISWMVGLVMFPLAFVLVHGRFGRALRAVRDSEIAVDRERHLDRRRQDGRIRRLGVLLRRRRRPLRDRHHLREPRHVPDRPLDPPARRHRRRRRRLAGRHGLRGPLRRVHPASAGARRILDLSQQRASHQHPRARVGLRRSTGSSCCSCSTSPRRA